MFAKTPKGRTNEKEKTKKTENNTKIKKRNGKCHNRNDNYARIIQIAIASIHVDCDLLGTQIC